MGDVTLHRNRYSAPPALVDHQVEVHGGPSQPFSEEPLTGADAAEIDHNVNGVLALLREWKAEDDAPSRRALPRCHGTS